MPSFSLAARDQLVLAGLGQYVRLLGQRQLADAFWAGDIANARRRLRKYVEMGWTERHTLLARPLPEMLAPVAPWNPGRAEPEAEDLSFRLQCRRRYAAPRPTVAYTPTRALIEHFGGSPKRSLATQASHDLGVAAIWLWYCQNRCDYVQAWVSEDSLQDDVRGEAVPDAVLIDEEQEPQVWIEFGGDYSAHRIRAFHDSAAGRSIPYQIW